MKHNNNFDLVRRGEDREPLSFFDGWFDDFMPMFSRKEMKEFNSIMKTDVKETEKNYILDVDLPGFKKEDVNLNLENGYLTISAKREHKVDNENRKESLKKKKGASSQDDAPLRKG